MSDLQIFFTMLVLAVGTMITRFLPFLLFPDGKEKPPVISYLSRTLPYAVMGLLVIYCLKSVSPVEYPHGIPEILSVAVVAFLQYRWSKTLVSITAGTVLYMILIQCVFI